MLEMMAPKAFAVKQAMEIAERVAATAARAGSRARWMMATMVAIKARAACWVL